MLLRGEGVIKLRPGYGRINTALFMQLITPLHHSTPRMFQRTLDDYTYAQEHNRSGGGGVFGVRVTDVTVRYDYRRTYPSSTLNPRNLPVR